MNYYLKSFGCSLNKADSESIRALFKEHGFMEVPLEKADLVLINTCAVKEVTENRMIKRTRDLLKEKKKSAELIVFGCLAKINPERLKQFNGKASFIGPSMKELASFLSLQGGEFSPSIKPVRFNPLVSIIPISRGCSFNCAFCCVKKARGNLKSHSIASIEKRFAQETKKPCEVWLTAQDTGSYGTDIKTGLPSLLRELLKVKGDYRIRVGMMNPNNLKRIKEDLFPLFEDKRLYRFLHIPVQSGSNRILKLMNRNYSVKDFVSLVKEARENIDGLTVSTDIIVGFPTETKADFEKTKKLLEEVKPDVVNISRFGDRPGIKARNFSPKVYGWVKKERSRSLSKLCKEIALAQNRKLVGKTLEAFVSEKGKNNSFVARTNSYKPVVIKENRLGEFIKVKAFKAEPTHLLGEVL